MSGKKQVETSEGSKRMVIMRSILEDLWLIFGRFAVDIWKIRGKYIVDSWLIIFHKLICWFKMKTTTTFLIDINEQI